MDRSGDGWDQRWFWERHAAAAGESALEPGAGPARVDPPVPAPEQPARRRPAWLAERVTFPRDAATDSGAGQPTEDARDGTRPVADPLAAVRDRAVADRVLQALRDDPSAIRDRTAELPASGVPEGGGDAATTAGALLSLRSRLVRAGAMTVLVVAVATAVAYATRPERYPSAADPGRPIYPIHDSQSAAPIGAGESPTPEPSASVEPSLSGSPPPATGTPAPSANAPEVPPPPPPPPPPPTTTSPVVVTAPAAGQTVQLVNAGTGGYVGVAGNGSADGASVVQTFNRSWTSTRWRLQNPSPTKAGCFVLVQAGTNKALDVRDAGLWDGTPMQLWTADGSSKQTWCFEAVAGGFSLQNQYAHRLLDLRDGSSAEGAMLQQWGAEAARPNQNQTWRLLLVP